MPFIPAIPPEFRAAYQEYDREITIRKTQWGCILGILLVPVFGMLDFIVFKEQQAWDFLALRFLCSLLMAGLYLVLGTNFGKKYYHFQGIVLLFLPSATIAYMIHAGVPALGPQSASPAESPYYAGLTLVLLVLAVVLDWPLWQSIVSVLLVLVLYLAACFFSPVKFEIPKFITHLFFLISSGIAIIAGTVFHSRVRIKGFISSMQRDESNQKLEASLQQLKENEMQLVQSEKLASFGLMAAGIMHEINNALTYPKSGLRYLERKSKSLGPEQEAEQVKVLTKIKDGLDFVGVIVSGLQDFAHPNTEQSGPVPVSEVVTQAKLFLSNKWQGTVQIEQQLAADQIIWGNKTKTIQVLMNLLNNSLDALKTKSFTNGEKPTIWIEGRVENGHSILSVRDNGPGIKDEIRDRIYEPFFTTKGPGAGTGLGLSICLGIVREAKGEILMKSEPGKFCEFTLKFPAGETNHAKN
jgi:signal transduction histidine kinase